MSIIFDRDYVSDVFCDSSSSFYHLFYDDDDEREVFCDSSSFYHLFYDDDCEVFCDDYGDDGDDDDDLWAILEYLLAELLLVKKLLN